MTTSEPVHTESQTHTWTIDVPNHPTRADNTHISGCGGHSHWVHIGYINSTGLGYWNASSVCAGFVGNAAVGGRINGFCGGNNSGHLYGSKPGHADINWHYGRGNYYALWAPNRSWGVASTISISGYKSNDTCPDFNTVAHSHFADPY